MSSSLHTIYQSDAKRLAMPWMSRAQADLDEIEAPQTIMLRAIQAGLLILLSRGTTA